MLLEKLCLLAKCILTLTDKGFGRMIIYHLFLVEVTLEHPTYIDFKVEGYVSTLGDICYIDVIGKYIL